MFCCFLDANVFPTSVLLGFVDLYAIMSIVHKNEWIASKQPNVFFLEPPEDEFCAPSHAAQSAQQAAGPGVRYHWTVGFALAAWTTKKKKKNQWFYNLCRKMPQIVFISN